MYNMMDNKLITQPPCKKVKDQTIVCIGVSSMVWWVFFFQKWFQLTHSRVLLVATDSWPIHRQVGLWIHG